jgi:hypothetical protein
VTIYVRRSSREDHPVWEGKSDDNVWKSILTVTCNASRNDPLEVVALVSLTRLKSDADLVVYSSDSISIIWDVIRRLFVLIADVLVILIGAGLHHLEATRLHVLSGGVRDRSVWTLQLHYHISKWFAIII